ncbi:(2Fe-2S) ferredoxin domain-containing protein [Anaerobium acetethylicum]|uniref:NADP-reducing hydrogenase subunit HndB/NADP-reducing hydrogenase subunit HndC n=1 Tax=Anaerobium acetethylicum TaxID=1619234 RepID=A0A1D3TPI6_9FIRM|nr:(2Fe-2S) ferredoxin domain-containing protein [Anaerobium acetethylicum]SCP95365.1 NADP-reducing hydrogenase subunit HndB/NADP-reducing hydrogenase subunit HndC [Anaerobium acetethylicum]
MARIKSLEELQNIRQAAKDKFELREIADKEDRIIVRVGMATCGIASGARETLNAIIDELAKQDMHNVSVTQTGCIGYCAEEPVVEVIYHDQPSVLYGHVDAARGREIVKEHLQNGRLLQNAIITRAFEQID